MTGNTTPQKITTSWGEISVLLRGGRVIGCILPQMNETPAVPFAVLGGSKSTVAKFICDTFRGCRPDVPPIGELQGSLFQKKVWLKLQEIPAGETRSYREVAEAVGNPRACRAVANACGKNPAPLFVPCHRVIGADGRLHGFSAGAAWKRMLLNIESRFAI